ncbi:unnamed protein product [Moneuplotes crassus]|uniref:Uncharacterized protein n=1 Tax=Euplotes crassus TaxID=5936 RepID=A0AAD1XQJ4_EUPCR|nr:unnamed protein product [Moneuplotes crassus]
MGNTNTICCGERPNVESLGKIRAIREETNKDIENIKQVDDYGSQEVKSTGCSEFIGYKNINAKEPDRTKPKLRHTCSTMMNKERSINTALAFEYHKARNTIQDKSRRSLRSRNSKKNTKKSDQKHLDSIYQELHVEGNCIILL